jgi:hypothetical protein
MVIAMPSRMFEECRSKNLHKSQQAEYNSDKGNAPTLGGHCRSHVVGLEGYR